MNSPSIYDRSQRGLRLVTGPVVEPLTVAQAKEHLRIESDVTRDDVYVRRLIRTARAWAESYTRRVLCAQTWMLTLDEFPTLNQLGIVSLVKPPLRSVTEIAYVDTAGTRIVLDPATYRLDKQDTTARVEPVFGTSWPATERVIGSVQITHVSGYTDGIKIPGGPTAPDNAPADGDPLELVPDPIKFAMLLLIGGWFENREETVVGQAPMRLPFGAEDLLSPFLAMRWP